MATWSRRPTMPMRWFATRPAPAVPVPRSRQPDFDRLDTWNETSFADRRADVEATIDGLLAHGDFRDVIDAETIGAAGHSLGGYTVVGMAGGWAGWLDRRIRAVLGLSPYVMPFQVQERLGNVQVPLMYQGGTLDRRHHPVPRRSQRGLSPCQPAGVLPGAAGCRPFRLGQLRQRPHHRIVPRDAGELPPDRRLRHRLLRQLSQAPARAAADTEASRTRRVHVQAPLPLSCRSPCDRRGSRRAAMPIAFGRPLSSSSVRRGAALMGRHAGQAKRGTA